MLACAHRTTKGPPADTPCSNCGHTWPLGADLCPGCGNRWVPKNNAFWPYHVAQETILRRPSEAVILHTLAGFTDYRSAECRPSIRTLMKRTGFDRRTVQRAIRGLIDKKVIEVYDRHAESGARRSNRYALLPKNPLMTDEGGGGASDAGGAAWVTRGSGTSDAPLIKKSTKKKS